MNKRKLIGVGVIAVKASRDLGSSDLLSLVGEANAGEKLLSDIRQYRQRAASLSPEVAAERWFELYDGAASVEAQDSSTGLKG